MNVNGGQPTFSFNLNYDVNCVGSTCTDHTTQVLRTGTISNTNAYALSLMNQSILCTTSGSPSYSGTPVNGWGVQTTQNLSPGVYCSQGSTYVYLQGEWVGSTFVTFDSYFANKNYSNQDYVRY